ncbi:SDR family oxidoreductase [soil metagenome]
MRPGDSPKRIIITGATGGIGLAAAKALAAGGAAVTIVARNEERARAAVADIAQFAGDALPVEYLVADLASQAAVREVASTILDRYSRIDVLVNNAGAIFWRRRLTVDGIERTWAVNHLAPFLLTTLLLDRLKASAPARIVTTASSAHLGATIPFDDLDGVGRHRGLRRYGESKLANILFTLELAWRLAGTGVTATCFHPGLVRSGFNRNNGWLMAAGMFFLAPVSRSPERGADTLVWLATSPEAAGKSGGYYVDRKKLAPSNAGQNTDAARRLWEISERQVATTETHSHANGRRPSSTTPDGH